MQLPIVVSAPLMTAHDDVFRDLFEHWCQFQYFQKFKFIPIYDMSLTARYSHRRHVV
jgi:hypothetical protein